MKPQGVRTGKNIYFYRGLFYHFNVKREDFEDRDICLYDERQKIALIYPVEEVNRDFKYFFNFTEILKPGKVFYRDGLVYKYCKTPKEFEENMDFFNRNPRVTLEIVFRDSKEFVIISKYVEYINLFKLKKNEKPNLRKPLVILLSKFGKPYKFKNDLVQKRNIGYNGKDLIFFEETGEQVGEYNTLVEFIQAVFKYIKDSESDVYRSFLRKDSGVNKQDPPFIEEQEILEILGNEENPIVL
jgi:hypothetical protein